MPKRSAVDQFDDEAIASAVSQSSNYSDCLRRLELQVTGSTWYRLKKRCRHLGLDTSHFRRGDITRIPADYIGSARHREALNLVRQSIGELECAWCGQSVHRAGVKKHELHCYLNPQNKRECPCCGKPIKGRGTTCSKSCANTYFRSGSNHPNWKADSYRSTCFEHHPHECVVCQEALLVEVHHLDGDHSNNAPENLVPLCSTHHQYWHSRYRHMVEQTILDYVHSFVAKRALIAA